MQSFVSRLLTATVAAVALCASGTVLAQKVKLATSAGDIVVELDAAKSPKTVANFLEYVKSGHYDGTIFHRVIENFMNSFYRVGALTLRSNAYGPRGFFHKPRSHRPPLPVRRSRVVPQVAFIARDKRRRPSRARRRRVAATRATCCRS